jgi:4-aminobutyrate aminotransferase/(S)-3-amino-2-methylpropionate transaminase
MEQFENGPWLNRAMEIGEIMKEKLDAMVARYPFLAERRGRGAMQALEIVQPGTMNPDAPLTEEILKACYERGVIPLSAGTYGNVIRMLPPLAITNALLMEALDVLDSACSDIAASKGMLSVSAN